MSVFHLVTFAHLCKSSQVDGAWMLCCKQLGLVIFFYKGPDNKYASFAGPTICVATTQLGHCGVDVLRMVMAVLP